MAPRRRRAASESPPAPEPAPKRARRAPPPPPRRSPPQQPAAAKPDATLQPPAAPPPAAAAASGVHMLFAHGAGAGSAHPWMRAWSTRLARFGSVRTFDYDYMARGSRRPDPQPKLEATHAKQLEALAREAGGPVVLVGKSMGSRIGCHVAARRPELVRAVVCFGYPLVGAGKNNAQRAEALAQIPPSVPVLLVSGSRDPMAPRAALEAAVARMRAPATLHWVDGGDHSLIVPKRGAPPQARVDDAIVDVVARFLASL